MPALHLQDPTQSGRTLLDVLVEAADGADRGGGIFAFASARGVAALLDDAVLRDLTFELVVGVDAITDERALGALVERARKRPGLRARVLLHELPTLFHPKLCWFVTGDRLTLVAGSGNLTPGGLENNFEAFTVITFDAPEAAAIERQIDEWLAHWDTRLLAPDAPKVVARAKQNSGAEKTLRKPAPPEPEDETAPALDADWPAVVAEAPRNAPRRLQLDIGSDIFSGFFGGVPDKPKRIRIQHIDLDGTLEEPEPPRALFETRSRNYRFEAGAGRGRDYPDEGRPIVTIVRCADGIFRYHALYPGEPGHAEAEAFLPARRRPSDVRRVRTDVATLRAAWPGSPIWSAL